MPNDLTCSWWSRREFLLDRYRSEEERYEAIIQTLVRMIGDVLQEAGIIGAVRGRVKSFDAFYRKLLERAASEDEIESPFLFITDLLGIRVVMPFVEDIGKVADALRRHFELTEVDDKAAALTVREFGYASTHLLVTIPPEQCEAHGPLSVREIEIQLRTTLQDAWAEVEHELVYKSGLDVVDTQVRRKLVALNATLSLADMIFQEIRDYQKQRYRTLVRQHQDLMDKVSTIPRRCQDGVRRGVTLQRLAAGSLPFPIAAPSSTLLVCGTGRTTCSPPSSIRAGRTRTNSAIPCQVHHHYRTRKHNSRTHRRMVCRSG